MENVKKINEKLTVSAQITSEQLQQAAREGYKSVLNLRSPDEEGFWKEEQEKVEALGLEYVNIPVKVSTLTEELTTEILKQIDELPKPTLIHCGVSMRAGAMALMNIATREGMTPEEAFGLAEKIGFDCSAYPQMKQFFAQYVSTHGQTK
ncbi:MAG: protein tyrosine phosphatase family protein [Nostocaceae cyanobacterium]|nr:protein tyrosine phosphatase family protein [Nostocaceae cyanobacterium]